MVEQVVPAGTRLLQPRMLIMVHRHYHVSYSTSYNNSESGAASNTCSSCNHARNITNIILVKCTWCVVVNHKSAMAASLTIDEATPVDNKLVYAFSLTQGCLQNPSQDDGDPVPPMCSP